MTPAEIDAAIKAAGLGWGLLGAITTAALAQAERCNVHACVGYAALANELGMTTGEFVPALVLLAGDPLATPPVLPDRSVIDTHIAAKKAFKVLLAARAIAWSCEAGVMLVWSTGDRSTELRPRWNDTAVTTQAYLTQAGLAGADMTDMADALADLVDGDSTSFDIIMSA